MEGLLSTGPTLSSFLTFGIGNGKEKHCSGNWNEKQCSQPKLGKSRLKSLSWHLPACFLALNSFPLSPGSCLLTSWLFQVVIRENTDPRSIVAFPPRNQESPQVSQADSGVLIVRRVGYQYMTQEFYDC